MNNTINAIFSDPAPVRFLDDEGNWAPNQPALEYENELQGLSLEDMQNWYLTMLKTRTFDSECTNLQRQGQLALWAPSMGQEGAQVGIAYASKPDDHLFPTYREHLVASSRGVRFVDIAKQFRGVSHGGWNPAECGNVHLYTLVLGAQAHHANGYALGQVLNAKAKLGDTALDPDTPGVETVGATIVFYGDGTSSQGEVSEAMTFASSYQTPLVFFMQNNHWAISVPVERQSRTPLYRRALGFGIPAVQIDGNDPLASYAVSNRMLRNARAGEGPQFIEALTYRMGAHTTSDDPTRYREKTELEGWEGRDPLLRLEKYLRQKGAKQDFFNDAKEQAAAISREVRESIMALTPPNKDEMFASVYSSSHSGLEQQQAWLENYEASFGGNNE